MRARERERERERHTDRQTETETEERGFGDGYARVGGRGGRKEKKWERERGGGERGGRGKYRLHVQQMLI